MAFIAKSTTGSVFIFLALCQRGVSVTCSEPVVSAGLSYRWPEENQGLVAPVTAIYDYPSYNSPLTAEFTGNSIAINIPGSYEGGFMLTTNVEEPPADSQNFRLSRIELRRAGQAPAGQSQQLPHTIEIALIHVQDSPTPNAYYANMVIPVDVTGAVVGYDLLDSLINGGNLPASEGAPGTVLQGPGSILDLQRTLEGSKFLTYWNTLPSSCDVEVPTRFMMKLNTIQTSQQAFNQLLSALQSAPIQQALPASSVAWLVGTCLSGAACTLLEAVNLEAQLTSDESIQTQAVNEVRSRRTSLDSELAQMATGVPGAFDMAVSDRNDLRTASEELQQIAARVTTLTSQLQQNQTLVWDDPMPAVSTLEVASSSGSNSTSNSSSSSLSSSNSSAYVSLLAGAVHEASQKDCNVLARSPIDIFSELAIDPATAGSQLVEPLRFDYMSLAQMEDEESDNMLTVSNNGQYLHVSAGRRATKRVGPLGAIISDGLIQGVSFIDVHMPGQHAVDGKLSDVELQVVHVSPADKPNIGIVVRLDVVDHEEAANKWLDAVLREVPQEHESGELGMKPLAMLHQVFDQESTDKYFRYDGTLTAPPCRPTEWYILEEPGRVSQQQLLSLQSALPSAGVEHERFTSATVLRGSASNTAHPAQIGLAGLGSWGHKKKTTLRSPRRLHM